MTWLVIMAWFDMTRLSTLAGEISKDFSFLLQAEAFIFLGDESAWGIDDNLHTPTPLCKAQKVSLYLAMA